MGKVKASDHAELTDFKALSFDVYSTLIDEPGGMFTHLLPLFSHLPASAAAIPWTSSRTKTLSSLSHFERELQASQPTLKYDHLLEEAYLLFAESLGVKLTLEVEREARSFGGSIASWTAFEDTVDALRRLGKFYKLVILSNTVESAIQGTIAGPLEGVRFDAVYTAEKIGSYKPDRGNFTYLLENVERDLGIKKSELLHTAQSLRCDLVPAKEMRIQSCWIDRTKMGMERKDEEGETDSTWRFQTLGEMADAVEAAFAEKKKEREKERR